MATKKEEYFLKIIVVGKAESGKTSLCNRFSGNKAFKEEYKPTIGADFSTDVIEFDDVLVTSQTWDLAGQERFACLVTPFMRGSGAVIVVYDINDENALEGVEKWRKEVLSTIDRDNIPMMLVANKCDLMPINWFRNYDLQNGIKLLVSGYCRIIAIKFEMQIPTDIIELCQYYSEHVSDGQKYALGNNMEFLHCSVKNGTNVEKVFKDIAYKAYERLHNTN